MQSRNQREGWYAGRWPSTGPIAAYMDFKHAQHYRTRNYDGSLQGFGKWYANQVTFASLPNPIAKAHKETHVPADPQ